MKTARAVLLVLLIAFCSLAAKPAEEKEQAQSPDKVPEATVTKLNHVMEAIHTDIKALQENRPWLKGYHESCLNDNPGDLKSIDYNPRIEHQENVMAPDQLHIYCGPSKTAEQIRRQADELDGEENKEEESGAEHSLTCHFPSLGIDLNATILAGDKQMSGKAIRASVKKRCEELQKELKK